MKVKGKKSRKAISKLKRIIFEIVFTLPKFLLKQILT